MAPRQGKFDDDAKNATVPGLTVDTSLGAPPTTRMAAALDYAEAAIKMRRRRVNKSAVHRELGLLQRALATFVGDFNVRLATLKTMTYYDEATAKELKKVAVVATKLRRGSRGGARVQKRRRRQAVFEEGGWSLRLAPMLTLTLRLKLQQESRNRWRMRMRMREGWRKERRKWCRSRVV